MRRAASRSTALVFIWRFWPMPVPCRPPRHSKPLQHRSPRPARRHLCHRRIARLMWVGGSWRSTAPAAAAQPSSWRPAAEVPRRAGGWCRAVATGATASAHTIGPTWAAATRPPKPRTLRDMAQDLRALLQNAGVDGPYILVGHSMGGMLVRVYRDLYPAEVAGLVLVESAHPDMGRRLLAALPPESAGEPADLVTWRRFLDYQWMATGRESYNLEGFDAQAGNAQTRSARPLGDMPLTVISRSPGSIGFGDLPPLPPETAAALSGIWQELQGEMEGLSSRSGRVTAVHAGHMIPTEEPELGHRGHP